MSKRARGGENQSFKRKEFGGCAGGPISKDHTFFFADYEGRRQGLGVSSLIPTPWDNARNGQLANGSMITVSPLVKPYLALYPRANCPSGVDTCPFILVANTITNEDFVTARIDHKLSASDSLFGTYLFDKGGTASPDTFNLKSIGTQSRRHTAALEESHIFTSALLNTTRLGFNPPASTSPPTLAPTNPPPPTTPLASLPAP